MSEDTTYKADAWPVSEVDKLRRENTQLTKENATANKRIEELFKEKQELERKYNLLRYGSED